MAAGGPPATRPEGGRGRVVVRLCGMRRMLSVLTVVAAVAASVVPSSPVALAAGGVPSIPTAREVEGPFRKAWDVSADGNYAITFHSYDVTPRRRVDLRTGQAVDFDLPNARILQLSSDGSKLYYEVGYDIRQYSFATGTSVSVPVVGAPAGWNYFDLVDVSANGRYLGLSGGKEATAEISVFVYDTVTHEWRRPDDLLAPFPPESGIIRTSQEVSLSADGRYAAWAAMATAGYRRQVFVYDWQTNTAVIASPRLDGAPFSDGFGASNPQISPDGREVVFRANSSGLVDGYSTVASRVYVRLLDRSTTLMVTEHPSSDPDWRPSLGANGSAVGVLEDLPTDLPAGGTYDKPQPVVYYLPAMTRVVLTQTSNGSNPDGWTIQFALATSANRAVFTSRASNFTTLTTDAGENVFVSDLVSALPTRIMDTRPGHVTDDGLMQGTGVLAAGSTTSLVVGGRRDIPTDAAAVTLNVTVPASGTSGYLTVYPCGATKPVASSVNFSSSTTVANMVISGLGTAHAVCIFTSAATHVVVDVTSVFAAGSPYSSLQPARLLDTRPSGATIDGLFQQTGLLPASTDVPLQVSGRGGVPDGALAAALNVTVVTPLSGGYVIAYPCGGSVPLASMLNFQAGITRASLAVLSLSASGQVCIRASVPVQLLADVVGTYPSSTAFVAMPPARLADTRPTGSTVDHLFEATGVEPAGGTMQLQVSGRGGVPVGNQTVSLDVIASGPTAAGYLTVYPCGLPRPTTSSVNFVVGGSSNNHVIVETGVNGTVCIYSSGANKVIVDVEAVLP